jgi:neutral amino acid transport system permease protein
VTRRTTIGLLLSILFVLLAPIAGYAEGETVKGRLESIEGDERIPVEGVTITVESDGSQVGTAVSDAEGVWEIPVPGAGTYLVRLETDTLPDGVALTDPEAFELPEVAVRDGQNKTVRFNLGPGLVSTVTFWERASGLFVIGLKLGAVIALSSIGLSLIFGVTGLVNFAHGELLTLGAALALFFNASSLGPGWHVLIAAVPAVLLVAGFGGAQERWLWRPLRAKGAGVVSMIVVSIGLSFALRYLILIVLGGLPRPYTQYAVQSSIDFLGISIVPKNLYIIGFSLVVLSAFGLFLVRTKIGTAMRAVADNADLAESSGIDVQRVILVTWLVGAGLAAMGGVMFGISEQVQYDMGFRLLLLIFSAVILGGLGTAFGAMLGGFVIGVLVEMSTLWLPVEFKVAVGLAILIVMLLVRPQGLLGSRERVG